MKKIKTAIYIRVSTEEQSKKYSPGNQREECIKKAKSLGAKYIVEYSDSISGSVLSRPGLTLLREAVKNGEISLVVCLDPDRLARKLQHQLLIADEIEKRAKLEFVNFEWENTPEGKMFFAMRGAFAEYEREKIRIRTSRGRLQKAKSGKPPSFFHNYGLNYNKEKEEIFINNEEAPVIKNIFKWFLEEDMGINGVANRLNSMGVPTKKQKGKWHRQVVRQILMNPIYKGDMTYNRYNCWDYSLNKHKPQDERVKMVERDKSEWVIIKVPAIIERDIWEAAQNKLTKARRLWVNKGKKKYLLSGLVSCGDCGNTMTGVYANDWGKKKRYYTCRKSCTGYKNPGCKPQKRVPASMLEDAVWEKIKKLLDKPEIMIEEISPNMNNDNINEELNSIEKQLKNIAQGQTNIINIISSGLVPLDKKTKEKLLELKKQEEFLLKRKKEVEKTSNNRIIDFDIRCLKKVAKELIKHLDKMSFDDKKTIIRILVDQVIIYGAGVDANIVMNMQVSEIEMSKLTNIVR